MTLEVGPRQEQAEGEQPIDGRTARGQRTRSSVVDALLALQEEGDLAPTAQRVAARAGVALRTVFGHFSDMETLWAEAGQRELEKLHALVDVLDDDLPFEDRLDRFCAYRARMLEALMPVARAARLREPTSPQLMRNRRMFIEAGDRGVRAAFAAELEPLDQSARDAKLDALYLVSSGPAWESLRHDRDLSAEQATEVFRVTVRAVLTA